MITYCLAVILFCVAFYFTKLLTTCKQIIVIALQAMTTITDVNLDDAAKEKATKAAAINMLKNSFSLVIKFLIIIGVTVLPLWLADVTGMVNFSVTSKFALRLDVLLITTIIAMAIVFLGRKLLNKQ